MHRGALIGFAGPPMMAAFVLIVDIASMLSMSSIERSVNVRMEL
jgi:hypothetical protein